MKYKTKTCERCNEQYTGTASSKYCITCKDVIISERKVKYFAQRKARKNATNN